MDNLLYKRLKDFSETEMRVLKLSYSDVESDELISLAFLRISDKSEQLNEPCLKKHIKNICREIYYKKIKWDDITDKICPGCMDVLPLMCFGSFIRKRSEKKEFQVYCQKCMASKMKAIRDLKRRFAPKKETVKYADIKEANRERFKIYYHKNKEKHLAYVRERYRKKKLNKSL